MYMKYTAPGTTRTKPRRVANRIGAAEKEKIASNASTSILNGLYFDRPVLRFGASKGTSDRLKPIHAIMPRRNRWRSGIEQSARCARGESRQKSAAAGMMGVSVMRLMSQ